MFHYVHNIGTRGGFCFKYELLNFAKRFKKKIHHTYNNPTLRFGGKRNRLEPVKRTNVSNMINN